MRKVKGKNFYFYLATDKMKSNIEQPWLEAGYKLFLKEGPAGLKVDQLARAVGISRSTASKTNWEGR